VLICGFCVIAVTLPPVKNPFAVNNNNNNNNNKLNIEILFKLIFVLKVLKQPE
jgi:hypothetical protein